MERISRGCTADPWDRTAFVLYHCPDPDQYLVGVHCRSGASDRGDDVFYPRCGNRHDAHGRAGRNEDDSDKKGICSRAFMFYSRIYYYNFGARSAGVGAAGAIYP